MKKVLILVLIMLCSIASVASARPGRYDARDERREHREYQARERAERVLRETKDYIIRAQNAARRGRYSYGLGRAYSHQQEARELYRKGFYNRAVDHSLRARDYAIDIIEANRTRRYRSYPRRHYSQDDELEQEIRVRIVDDNVAIKLHFEF